MFKHPHTKHARKLTNDDVGAEVLRTKPIARLNNTYNLQCFEPDGKYTLVSVIKGRITVSNHQFGKIELPAIFSDSCWIVNPELSVDEIDRVNNHIEKMQMINREHPDMKIFSSAIAQMIQTEEARMLLICENVLTRLK